MMHVTRANEKRKKREKGTGSTNESDEPGKQILSQQGEKIFVIEGREYKVKSFEVNKVMEENPNV